jgi:hypothetical protein
MKTGKTVLGIMTGIGITGGITLMNKTSYGKVVKDKVKDLFDGGRAKKVVLDREQFQMLFDKLEETNVRIGEVYEEVSNINRYITADMMKQIEENDLVQRKQLNELKTAIDEIKAKL